MTVGENPMALGIPAAETGLCECYMAKGSASSGPSWISVTWVFVNMQIPESQVDLLRQYQAPNVYIQI